MKNIILVLLIISSQLLVADQSDIQLIQVADANNEMVSGAKIELMGTGKVFYTNLKGECYIPRTILNQSKSIHINCISYKTVQLKNFEINSKIILEFR